MRIPWSILVLTAGCDQVLGLHERDAAINAPVSAKAFVFLPPADVAVSDLDVRC